VRFGEKGYTVSELNKRKMPGIGKPCTWEDFIRFVADAIEPLMDRAEVIGFCFSYAATITPEMDGRVITIDKEVVITGCEGQLVAASLNAELERRGVFGKRIVILNDTVAVLLGGLAAVRRSDYSGFVGQVSGTGTNTCCSLPARRIGKIGMDSDRSMIVNLESGMYTGIPAGEFDRILDEQSNDPGSKAFEKRTAGVYLGELCRDILKAAAGEGLLSPVAAERISALGWIDSAVIDAWACGEKLESVCRTEEDRAFVQTVCTALFERSARCMCTNLAAILLLTGEGTDPEKPVCICAEGSLVQKGRVYRPCLEKLLKEEVEGKLGRYVHLQVSYETTLLGSAAAALLNT
jgi:hexokinase